MKQVININYHGRIIPIEVTAIEILKRYVASLEKHFANEPGKEEIINDIENRIAELFQEQLQKGSACITDEIVESIINNVGKPEDFDSESDSFSNTSGSGEEQFTNQQNGTPKRFFRNEKNKIIGGVCAGIADYLSIDVVVIRVVFVILFFSFGFGLIPYLVIWFVAPGSTENNPGERRKKLYRDTDRKIIAGVCGGLAHYFGVDIWVPRVVFFIPLLGLIVNWHWSGIVSFLPGAIVAYIICWLVIPEAQTTSEKLEMKGEKVDIDSIKKNINKELDNLKQTVKEKGEELEKNIRQTTNDILSKAQPVKKSIWKILGQTIAVFIKLFVYLILGTIILACIVSLFSIALGSFVLLPLSSFLFSDNWQSTLAVMVIVFFLVIPAIGLTTWLIRKLAGRPTGRKSLRWTFILFWIIGWFSVFALAVALAKDFSRESESIINQQTIKQPANDSLVIHYSKNPKDVSEKNEFGFGDVLKLSQEPLYINNVVLKIRKAESDSFSLLIQKKASGKNKGLATERAKKIVYNIRQTDNHLYVENGFFINENEPFRMQQVILLLSVPVGKNIVLPTARNIIHEYPNESAFRDFFTDPAEKTVYTMTPGGLIEKK